MSDNLSDLLERVSKREDNINANMNEKVTIMKYLRVWNIKEEMKNLKRLKLNTRI